MALSATGADLGDDGQDDVLGRHPGRQRTVDVDRHRLEGPQRKRLGASTCSTSEVPIPIASAPKAPWVEVWLSPQTIVIPAGSVPAADPPRARCPAPDLPSGEGGCRTRRSCAATSPPACGTPGRRSACRCRRSERCGPGGQRQIGTANRAPASRRPSKACGLVTLMDQMKVDVDQVGFTRGAGTGSRHHDVVGPHLLGQGARVLESDICSSHNVGLLFLDMRQDSGIGVLDKAVGVLYAVAETPPAGRTLPPDRPAEGHRAPVGRRTGDTSSAVPRRSGRWQPGPG